MKFRNPKAQLCIPDGTDEEAAVKKITHMAIGAHQDDVEVMAYDGILKCYDSDDKHFFAVIATDGAGSPRSGRYSSYSNEEMKDIRKEEQIKAAKIGKYTALAMLDYPSRIAKDASNDNMTEEIKELILAAQPDVIYTHNLADKHDTHVAVGLKTIKAIRMLPQAVRPKKIYGCEGWRSLDWMNDDDKAVFDVDGNKKLASDLVEVFDSQVAGGKRYDKASIGRRLANATFFASHDTDTSQALIFAMDLTPLIEDDGLDIKEYVAEYIDRFEKDVLGRVTKLL